MKKRLALTAALVAVFAVAAAVTVFAADREATDNKNAGANMQVAAAMNAGAADGSSKMEFTGEIIDGACYSGHKDDLKAFAAKHTKDCVLAPGCRTSGMYLYEPNSGTALKFDDASSKKIVSFLEMKDSTLNVKVSAEKNADGTYKLDSIANQ